MIDLTELHIGDRVQDVEGDTLTVTAETIDGEWIATEHNGTPDLTHCTEIVMVVA